MLKLVTTGQFRKDYKRAKKRGYDMSLLEKVIDTLLDENVLEERYRDHALVGNYIGFRECHILPDWLLIYAIDKGKLVLTAARTGTHSDLFDKWLHRKNNRSQVRYAPGFLNRSSSGYSFLSTKWSIN